MVPLPRIAFQMISGKHTCTFLDGFLNIPTRVLEACPPMCFEVVLFVQVSASMMLSILSRCVLRVILMKYVYLGQIHVVSELELSFDVVMRRSAVYQKPVQAGCCAGELGDRAPAVAPHG